MDTESGRIYLPDEYEQRLMGQVQDDHQAEFERRQALEKIVEVSDLVARRQIAGQRAEERKSKRKAAKAARVVGGQRLRFLREHYESGEWIDSLGETTPPVDEVDPRMVEAQTRIDRIVTKLNTFNRANPQQPLMLNAQLMELAAGLDALAGALIDAGLLTTEDYAVRRAERIAGMFEQAWEQSAPDRRRAAGLVVPGR